MGRFMYRYSPKPTLDRASISGKLTRCQMSEEIKNASVIVPRSIMFTILINGSLGFSMLIMTLFSLNDVESALDTPTKYPYMDILLKSSGSITGATILASILMVMQFCANAGLLASASRMCWSFARDRGLPGWRFLERVSILLVTQVIMINTNVSDLNLG